MDFSDFRSRAIAEGRRYGKDEYVFVREFAQNARDAGAKRISLSAVFENGQLKIEFTDDGEGMAFDHARRYLFTLYASSKEKEVASAGQFGVGFWSILLFSPHSILIFSKTKKENWGVEFNQTLERERSVASHLEQRGTQVVAFKEMDAADAEKCIGDLAASLKRYCRYLRRNDRIASPLEVLFNGSRIDGPMVLEGECAATFSYRDIQGAVALGKSPQVSLHVRGLPVWSGTSLSELEYGAAPEVPISYPSGLAPVYLLNGNRLSVTLDRRSVFDDAALQKTRRIAGREMRRLVAQYLDNIAPPGLLGRLEYFFSTFSEDFLYHFNRRVLPFLPVVVILLAVGLGAFYFFPEKFKNVYDASESENWSEMPFLSTYRGGASFSAEYEKATTDSASGEKLEMQYTPPDRSMYFRTQVVDLLDPHNGARSGRLTPYRMPAQYECQHDCIDISLLLDSGAGVYHLPVPTGYYIDQESVTYDSAIDGQLLRSSKDDWLFIQKDGAAGEMHYIRYRAGAVTANLMSPERFLATPDVQLPMAYAKALKISRGFKTLEKRVVFLTALVEQSISYDTSADTVARYRNFFNEEPPGDWYAFVFGLNRGDCDVKNIILVNLLRRLEIPSRLAIGYVGNNGRIEQGKHAWVEYYHDGWQVADATGQAPEQTSSEKNEAEESVTEDATDNAEVISESVAVPSVPPKEEITPGTPVKRSAPMFESPNLSILWVGVGIIGFVAGLISLLLFRKLRQKLPKPSSQQENLAAQMLQAALENDKMNIRGSGLFSRALIPTWNGPRITMKQAMGLARRRLLFYSEEPNPLVNALLEKKYSVISTNNPVFTPVVGRLAGSINLQEIATLYPVALTDKNEMDSPGHQVLTSAWVIARSIGLSEHIIIPCRGLTGMLFREFDLTSLPLTWKNGIPNRFIAVKLNDDAEWRSLISAGGGIRGAAILLLDRIAVHSDLLSEARDRIRAALAEHAQYGEE